MMVNIDQQFVLLARQHGGWSLAMPEQTGNWPVF
jgi:hypothetical protein